MYAPSYNTSLLTQSGDAKHEKGPPSAFAGKYIVSVQRSEAKSILYKEMRALKVGALCRLNRQLVGKICTKVV